MNEVVIDLGLNLYSVAILIKNDLENVSMDPQDHKLNLRTLKFSSHSSLVPLFKNSPV